MRVATLQYAPRLGELSDNIARADKILRSSLPPPRSSAAAAPSAAPSVASRRASDIDLLVLPELAFTGYNFPSLSAIRPHLEPTAAGPSTQWAKRVAHEYGCLVAVGYPELFTHHPGQESSITSLVNGVAHVTGTGNGNGKGIDMHHAPSTGQEAGGTDVVAYNSLVTVSSAGDIIAHYRKSHLYYTDESWAQESPHGFVTTELALPAPRNAGPPAAIKAVPETANDPASSTTSAHVQSRFPPKTATAQRTKIAWAICMDINPYRFLPHHYPLYEYATHARAQGADTCVLSTAWLTSLSAEELASTPAEPDWNTFFYWIERLTPLVLASSDASPLPEEAAEQFAASTAGGNPGDSHNTAATHGPLNHNRGGGSETDNPQTRMTTVVCANRAGHEPGTNPCGQDGDGVRYAGTSWIGRVGGDRVEIWGILGRGAEGVLRVDFSSAGPEKAFILKSKNEDDADADTDEEEGDE